MGDRTTRSLGEICSFKAGNAFKKELQGRAHGEVSFIKVSDLNLSGNEISISTANNWVSQKEADSNYTVHPIGSVIFAKIGVALTFNRRRKLVRPTILDNNMMSAIANGVEPDWLYHLLCTVDFNTCVSGTALPYLTVRDLSNIPVSVPPLPEQRAIAAVLSALDDKIELNRRMNATLEAQARALFADWFVHFGPTRAKMAKTTPYLAPEIWSLFPDRLDGKGIPEGWEAGAMIDLFVLQRGFDLPKSKRKLGSYPVFAASGPNGFHNEAMVKAPGVTTGRSGVLGNVFFVQEDFWPLNTSLWVKEFRRASPLFAYFFLSRMDLSIYNAGSAVPTLNRNHIHGLPTTIPPEEVVAAFDEMCLPIMELFKNNELESRTLAQARDLLLPKLMSGEIRVGEAQKTVEGAR